MVKKYKIYIDENLPSQLAKGLNELQKPQNIRDGFELEILSIKDVFGQGEQDEDWIPKVGAENGIVITQDFRIQTQRHQKELYIQSGIGILFLKPPSNNGFTYWEMVKKIINEWDNIKQIVRKNKTPFAFKCSSRTSFEKME
jgi:PIN like domain